MAYTAIPIRINVGAQNIKKGDVSSAAELGRIMKEAMGEIAGNFSWYVAQLEGFLPDDLRAALEPTFDLSQTYVPVMTGELKESGYLETEKFRGGARVEMGYGPVPARSGERDYAIYVHEVPAEHEPPTREKYLQSAIDEDYHNIIQRVTDNVRIRTGGV